jgi:hypothetical protein
MIPFGKYSGKSIELVVLKHPSYAAWLLGQTATTWTFREVQEELRRLIAIFDHKPLLKPCSAPDCASPATRATVYRGSTQIRWWCAACDPRQLGASPGKLYTLLTFADAVRYAASCSPDLLPTLIQILGQAKGLPDRVGERQAQAFFA